MSFEWLPENVGEVEFLLPLAPLTTLKVGGPVDCLVRPKSWESVAELMRAKPEDVPLTVLGLGSNMVVRDGGVAGLVLCLDGVCDSVDAGEAGMLRAEAGASLGKVARAAREHELDGVAFFGGIPGSVGGALRMNAGAYGDETYDRLVRVWVMTDKGDILEKEPAFFEPRYRGTELPEGWIFVAGEWALPRGDKEEIRAAMRLVNERRRTSQPLGLPSSGSWFKNVIVTEKNRSALVAVFGDEVMPGGKINAWRLVEAAGCRGWREGGAQVSEQHCNFFVNIGAHDAKKGEGVAGTFADFAKLSDRVEAEILAKLGVTMEREVKYDGRA
ncbi:MAG: UDP-N-acetylenolpyruvoylglucosamine reductase [Alphaproteobacteria bacterium CG_4_10_14_0_8_um_filter_53_9]|nr:MAG: UDP-N-acetylenolpyruvoylglucosamine reductase [Alphaproteobacteria bacterium CG_4_10_14_0_8_um_filter_53_9]